METLTALAELRSFGALAPARRQHLGILLATAPLNSDRALIVAKAREENRRALATTNAIVKAELASRRVWAAQHPPRAAEEPQRPSRPRFMDEEGVRHPEARPVVVTFTKPTKIAKAQPQRPEVIGQNNRERVAAQPESQKPLPEQKSIQHGTTTAYSRDRCRCALCKEAKKQSRRSRGLRRPNGEQPHGTTTRYQAGCRCQLCRDAVAAHARAKRAEQKRRA